MVQSISAEQFLEWMHYDAIDPFGEWRADYRAAEIVTMIANVNRDKKRRPTPFKTPDFLVRFGEPTKKDKPKQTWQDQLAIAKLFVAAHNRKQNL